MMNPESVSNENLPLSSVAIDADSHEIGLIGWMSETAGGISNLVMRLPHESGGVPRRYRVEYPNPQPYSLGNVRSAEGEFIFTKDGFLLSNSRIVYENGDIRQFDFLLTVVEGTVVTDLLTGDQTVVTIPKHETISLFPGIPVASEPERQDIEQEY